MTKVKYAEHLNAGTPQIEQARDDQVKNNAGGFVFKMDDFARLNRFLILGSEGGTYYASERQLTIQNVKCVEQCLKKDSAETIRRIVNISDAGRAAKNDPALLALAMAMSSDDVETKKMAFDALPKVARIGTHLFHVMEYVKAFRRYGRGVRNAVSKWYNAQSADHLAYGMLKYQQRDGWTHKDVLRLCHVKPCDEDHSALFKFATNGHNTEANYSGNLRIIEGFTKAKEATKSSEIVKLIEDYGLSREMIPTEFLDNKEVMTALLPKMPIHALLRNLRNLSKAGVLVDGNWDAIEIVKDAFENEEKMRKSRLHPFSILVGMETYRQGHGFRGQSNWPVVKDVIDILDAGFYKAFGNIEPTGKRTYIGLDVSGSMSAALMNSPISARTGSAAMAMVTYKTEKKCVIKGFTTDGRGFSSRGNTMMKELDFGRKSRLDSVVKAISELPFSRTDCALPMLDATNESLEIDTFIIYTDNETWHGSTHPFEALKRYRKQSGIDARLVVVGMTATEFSIADPSDAGMLDVVGFDTSAPAIISSFAKGEL